jgi:hypothetical protein
MKNRFLSIYIFLILFCVSITIWKKLDKSLILNTLILTSIFSGASIVYLFDYYFDYDNLQLAEKETLNIAFNLGNHLFLLAFNFCSTIFIMSRSKAKKSFK